MNTITTLLAYQNAASSTAIFPEDEPTYPFLGLCGEAGEVAELAKKCLRDEKGVWSPERLDMLKKELGDVLWYLSQIARVHGITLQDVAQTNIDKLMSRRARDQIKGSGDNR